MKEYLNIAMISRGDSSSGGAGRVAEQLAERLRISGLHVSHFLRRKPRAEYRHTSKLLVGIPGDTLLRNLTGIDLSGLQLLAQRELQNADIVHFHDFSVAYGAIIARVIAKFKPVVLTLHDFSGLSGGCLFPSSCTRYTQGCGDCPKLGTWPLLSPIDRTRAHFKWHQQLAINPKVAAVSPSRYLAARAKEGAWQRGCVTHIPNGVDTTIFHSDRRSTGRAHLKLTDEHRALLFVATNTAAKHKGFDDLWESFCRLASRDSSLHLVVLGHLNAKYIAPQTLQQRIHQLGFIDDIDMLASIYAGCDFLVLPSYADNFPMTLLEAMSCGTPAIAYRTGGIPEMLEKCPGSLLVDGLGVDALTKTLQKISGKPDSPQRRKLIRAHAVKHYSLDATTARHIDMYQRLIR